MMNRDNVRQSLILEPGKTIESLEGEIISVHFSQWGIYGKVKVQDTVFNYKLKNSESAKNVVVGLDLIIRNGFCIRNKKGEIVVTEGKFGSASTTFKIDRFYSKNQIEEGIMTGVIKSIDETLENKILEIELFLPPCKVLKCIVAENGNKETKRIKNATKITKGSIVKLRGEEKHGDFYAKSLDVIPENHFWYIFLNIKEGSHEQISSFYPIMNSQMEIVDSIYDIFKDILFNIGKEVSKTALVSLRDLLHSKIFNGELAFPYNVLISENQIREYFNQMVDFCREYIYANKNLNSPEKILLLIRNYYPEYRIKL